MLPRLLLDGCCTGDGDRDGDGVGLAWGRFLQLSWATLHLAVQAQPRDCDVES